MTAQGSPLTRFRRACQSGDPMLVLSAAADCRQLALDDALRVVVVLLDARDARYERAALRWHQRAIAEAGDVGADEAAFVLAMLQVLRGPARPSGAASLAVWLDSRGLERAGAVAGSAARPLDRG